MKRKLKKAILRGEITKAEAERLEDRRKCEKITIYFDKDPVLDGAKIMLGYYRGRNKGIIYY